MKNLIEAEKCLINNVKVQFETLNNVNTSQKNERYYSAFIKRFFCYYPAYFGQLNNAHSAPVLWQKMMIEAKNIRLRSPSNEAIAICEKKYREMIKMLFTYISQTGDDIPQKWLRCYYIATMQMMKFIPREEMTIASEKESAKKEFCAISEYLENQLIQEVRVTKAAKENMDIRRSVERTLHNILPMWEQSRNWIVDLKGVSIDLDSVVTIEMDEEQEKTFTAFVAFRRSISQPDLQDSGEKIKTDIFKPVLPQPVIMEKNVIGYVNARDIVFSLTGIQKEV
ncbi:MAG: hypothetical protein IJH61_09310 [Eubacteriaceae bacterium]|nr:hypothetical protein [Eubacteriaceae bacterium]